MFAKLKSMPEIFRDDSLVTVKRNNHYWKFYYIDKPTLGFRDFYLKYFKGDRLVTIKQKRDRKKNIIPGKFEVYGKRGNYVFTVYRYWVQWIENSGMKQSDWHPPIVSPRPRDIARIRSLGNLLWDELFEV